MLPFHQLLWLYKVSAKCWAGHTSDGAIRDGKWKDKNAPAAIQSKQMRPPNGTQIAIGEGSPAKPVGAKQ